MICSLPVRNYLEECTIQDGQEEKSTSLESGRFLFAAGEAFLFLSPRLWKVLREHEKLIMQRSALCGREQGRWRG